MIKMPDISIDSIQDLICNIKEAMSTYFYPKDTSDNRYAAKSHAHGQITNAGKIGTTANKPVITTTGGEVTTGSFGSTANTFAEGNHTHNMGDVNGLSTALSDKADSNHNHNTLYYGKDDMDTFLDGKAALIHDHDTLYYGKDEMDVLLLGKSDDDHNHDDRYNTKAEITGFLANKSNTDHTHTGTYPAMADFNALKGKYDKTSRVWVRLIRANQNGVPISTDTQLDNEGALLEVVTNYKLGAKVYTNDPSLNLNNLNLTLVVIGSNGWPTMKQTTTNSQGITKDMINLGNNQNGLGYALLKGTNNFNKAIDIKFIQYQ